MNKFTQKYLAFFLEIKKKKKESRESKFIAEQMIDMLMEGTISDLRELSIEFSKFDKRSLKGSKEYLEELIVARIAAIRKFRPSEFN